jgi:hypothetical protein
VYLAVAFLGVDEPKKGRELLNQMIQVIAATLNIGPLLLPVTLGDMGLWMWSPKLLVPSMCMQQFLNFEFLKLNLNFETLVLRMFCQLHSFYG